MLQRLLATANNTRMVAEKALMALGFTEIEARLYCELLASAPATGYRLAQAVGKAPANVYQALSSLEQKGAIVVDEGAAKSFRAVEPDELLSSIAAGFSEHQQAAKAALKRLHVPAPADKIFQLRKASQVLTRARRMLAKAREIILFDLFPEPLQALRPDLARAAARGVKVAGIVYSPEATDEFLCLPAHGQPRMPENWPGSQLTLVTDAREFLVALLSDDLTEVRHGFWSDCVYLACLQHSGLSCEVRLSALSLQKQDPLAKLALLSSMPSGLRELLRSSTRTPNRKAV